MRQMPWLCGAISLQLCAAAALKGLCPAGDGNDDLDPVLAHLLRKARAEAVRREFRATPAASYTERHDVTLLVGLHLA